MSLSTCVCKLVECCRACSSCDASTERSWQTSACSALDDAWASALRSRSAVFSSVRRVTNSSAWAARRFASSSWPSWVAVCYAEQQQSQGKGRRNAA